MCCPQGELELLRSSHSEIEALYEIRVQSLVSLCDPRCEPKDDNSQEFNSGSRAAPR